jgi:ferric-dicitrate binding protein FerR (iron transport regulator)
VGSYRLRPGASVDVSASLQTRERDGQIRFKVLRGHVSVTMTGTTRTLKAGERATLRIERQSSDRH